MIKLCLPDSGFPGQYMRPLPFFIGIAIGFIGLCLAGYWTTMVNPYNNFYRFYRYISPYTLFFPTVSQMVSIVEEKARDDQTIVIVGGDSIFNGMGQTVEELWSRKLARQLGDRYCVVNLSFHGMFPFEASHYAAEHLIKQGRRVVFVTNAQPHHLGTPEGNRMKRTYFEAYHRGMLIDYTPRQEAVGLTRKRLAEKHDDMYEELDLGTRIDTITNSSDLWHTVGYKLFFTVWEESTGSRWLYPRHIFPDRSPPIASDPEKLRIALKVIRRRTHEMVRVDSKGRFETKESGFELFRFLARTASPPDIRKNMLVVITWFSPEVQIHLTDDERARDSYLLEATARKFEETGYGAMVVGADFEESDYRDLSHFSPVGGAKLAKSVAEKIKTMTGEEVGE